jgi:DNA repair protein RecN (Recombination protein N)
MLKEVRIRHFGPFAYAEWTPHPAWTVLTGETGAGKSLLIEALQCIAGERVQARWFSPQSPWTEVEAVWEVPRHPQLRRFLQGLGLTDEGDDSTLVVQRRIYTDGRQQVWLQGRRSTLKNLQAVMRLFLDICDQWGIARMLSVDVQRAWLDAYGSPDDLLQTVRRLARRIRQHARTLRQRLTGMRQEWQELTAADLKPGEDEELERQFQLLSRSLQIQEAVEALVQELQEGETPFIQRVRHWQKTLEDLARWAPELAGYAPTLDEWRATAQALVFDLVRLRDRAQWDPAEWQRVESRLSLLEHLKRKYRMDYAGLLAYRDRLAQEIEQLERQLSQKDELRAEVERLYRAYREAAVELHHARVRAAQRLSEVATEQVRRLALPDAEIRVEVTETPLPETWSPEVAVHEAGADRVVFQFRSHGGLPFLPLVQVASGGELARAVLALKTVIGRTAWPRTVVFDEVDMGVGGEALEAVGQMLRTVAAFDQVITVTHWPQLAAMADDHWQVLKETQAGETVLTLRALTPAERVQEIVRMLGGQAVAPTVRAHAEALLQRFRKIS